MSNPYHAWWEEEKALAPLPANLQELLDQDDPTFINELKKFAYWCSKRQFYNSDNDIAKQYSQYNWRNDGSWIWTLYLNPHPLAKEGLLQLLADYAQDKFDIPEQNRTYYYYYHFFPFKIRGYSLYSWIPHNQKFYRYLKAIYKLAEKKQDTKIWSILAYRFDTADRVYHYTPYSTKTHYYLRRRAWRFLRTLGEANSSKYVDFATEVLLYYSHRNELYHPYGPPREIPYFTHLWLFNHILYRQSQRFVYGNGQNWKKIKTEPATNREEAFPHLWDQAPEQLWRLVQEANANPIIEFAGRGLQNGNPEFLARIENASIQPFLESLLSARRVFAVRVLLERNSIDQPNQEQILSYLGSQFHDIRRETIKFIENHIHKWSLSQRGNLISLLLEKLQESTYNPVISSIIDLLTGILKPILSQYATLELIDSLVKHKPHITEGGDGYHHFKIQQLAATLLTELDVKKHGIRGTDLLRFLTHQELIRKATEEILEEKYVELQLDADFLVQLVSLPGEKNQVFATQFIANRLLWMVPFIPKFLSKCWLQVMNSEQPDEVREYILQDILGSLLFQELKETPLSKILLLLGSNNTKFQEMGARLLNLTQPDPKSLSFLQLLELSHCPVALVRQETRNMIANRASDITPDWIVNLIETDWDDTREWMFNYVNSLPDHKITPDLVYGLLDTARTDVQQLAMELIEKHKQNLDLRELLLRASESPYLMVQEYALSLVNQVEWDVTLVKRLDLYFRTILFHINKGRQAKKKIIHLLLELGEKDAQLARHIVPLLSDVARNSGKQDFERILLTLTRIQTRFPDVETPLMIG